MPSINQPSQKELTRAYLRERQESRLPPPSPERIKEMMGWKMLEDELAAAINVTIRSR